MLKCSFVLCICCHEAKEMREMILKDRENLAQGKERMDVSPNVSVTRGGNCCSTSQEEVSDMWPNPSYTSFHFSIQPVETDPVYFLHFDYIRHAKRK